MVQIEENTHDIESCEKGQLYDMNDLYSEKEDEQLSRHVSRSD